jgi:hypothetical protein
MFNLSVSRCENLFELLKNVWTNVTIFCDVAPCSPYVSLRFGGLYHYLATYRTLVSFAANFYPENGSDTVLRNVGVRSTRRLIAEGWNIHNYCCENLKSYNFWVRLYVKSAATTSHISWLIIRGRLYICHLTICDVWYNVLKNKVKLSP